MNLLQNSRMLFVFAASVTVGVESFVPIRAPVDSVAKSSSRWMKPRILPHYQRPAPHLHLSSSTETEDAKRALIGDDSAYFALEEQVRAQCAYWIVLISKR